MRNWILGGVAACMVAGGGTYVIVHHFNHDVTISPAGSDKFQQDAADMEAAIRKQAGE